MPITIDPIGPIWKTLAAVLLALGVGPAAAAPPAVLVPYESLPWLKLGSTRQSDVLRAIGTPGEVVDEARFRSPIFDRRAEHPAHGLTLWYLFDGDPDPKLNQVLVAPPFKGPSALGLNLGAGREALMPKLAGAFKAGAIDEPHFVALQPVIAGHPALDLWFKEGRLSAVRWTAFLPPSERAQQDEARVATLVRQEGLQDGFAESPRCEYAFRVKRKLGRLAQLPAGVAAGNLNWRLELHENKQSGSWTLLGQSKDKLASSNMACELAGSELRGAAAGSYRETSWYRKYFP